MKNQRKTFFVFCITTFFVATELFLSGCGGLTVDFRNKRYTLIQSPDEKNKPTPPKRSVNTDEVNKALISGLEEAISTMEKWDELEPERRQSLIQSLKELASESKEVYDGTEQTEH